MISPIGAPGSPERQHADDIYEFIVQPAMAECGIEAVRSDHLKEPGRISDQMFREIRTNDLCVAVLTFQNPNVFYELAIAQAWGRPVIALVREGERLPFDVSDLRCIEYEDLDYRNLSDSAHVKKLIEGYKREVIEQVGSLERGGWRVKGAFGEAEVGTAADPRSAASPPGGGTLIGIDIGRSRTSSGLVSVSALGRARLPEPDDYEVIEDRNLEAKIDSPDIYAKLAGEVAGLADVVSEVDGIGVGIPGQVDPISGSLAGSPAAFRVGEHFAHNFARALAQHEAVRRSFGLEGADEHARRQIESRILIDNDVRCATRYVHSQKLADPGWQNFACVFVGSGVGTGLVLEKSLYYGSGGSAGEAGHMTIHLSPEQYAEGREGAGAWGNEGLSFHAAECACGRRGVHWEAVTNGSALGELARQTDPEVAQRLAAAFGDGSGEGVPALTAAQLGGAAAALEGHGGADDERVSDVLSDERVSEFVTTVVRRYAYLFTVGIANMVNLLNLDHVVLGGGVMDGLAPLRAFRAEWDRVLDQHALRVARETIAHFTHDEGARAPSGESAPGWAWQGSALLFWDPSYQAFCESRRR